MTCSIKTCTALTARRRRCWRNSFCSGRTGDEDSGVEPSEANVVGLFLGTGMAPSFWEIDRRFLKEQSLPVVSSQIYLFEQSLLYTTILMRRWRTTKDEKALGPRCSCLVAQREKRAYSRSRTGSGHTGRIPK